MFSHQSAFTPGSGLVWGKTLCHELGNTTQIIASALADTQVAANHYMVTCVEKMPCILAEALDTTPA